MASAGTLFHTVRHLRPLQIYHRLYRREPNLPRSFDAKLREPQEIWTNSIERTSAYLGANRFRFLNEEREIRTWNDADVPKLWIYNLHYFDHPEAELIDRWVAENPVGLGNGWEPYPLAVRIVNWIKWSLSGPRLSSTAIHNLQTQAEYLSQTLEYHLSANHLFADATALTMAGCFFEGEAARRWIRQGTHLLERELAEQVLPDGGHYERSPMYHAIVLENLLDLINTARTYGSIAQSQRDLWTTKARAMLAWQINMEHPDGQFAFFNDAAFGIAPDGAALRSYASRLGINPGNVALGASGYVRLQAGETTVLFDAAAIGPNHQPGHAHADTLSFELSHQGKRVLVNSGTSTYEKGPLREWQRSTSAHNTVTVDGLNQSEVWSSFRVARRARPVDVATDGNAFVEAAHDGYRRLSSPVLHRRRLEVKPHEVRITDAIEGRGRHCIELFFHFHPEAKPKFCLDPKLSVNVQDTFWYPAFNTKVPNVTIAGSWTGECPIQFATVIPLA